MLGTLPRTVCRHTFNLRSPMEVLQRIRVSTRSTANKLETKGVWASYSSEICMLACESMRMLGWWPMDHTSRPIGTMA